MNEQSIYRLNNNWNIHNENLKEKRYFLFNVKDGDIIKLNEVSYEILKNVDGEKSLHDIFVICNKIYRVNNGRLWKDIFEFINICINYDVISEA